MMGCFKKRFYSCHAFSKFILTGSQMAVGYMMRYSKEAVRLCGAIINFQIDRMLCLCNTALLRESVKDDVKS